MHKRRYKDANEAAKHLLSMTGIHSGLTAPFINAALSLEDGQSYTYWLYIRVWGKHMPGPTQLSCAADGTYTLVHQTPRRYARCNRRWIKEHRYSYAHQDTVPQE